ncbi:MAG: thioesterase family protein [Candidatus Eremiobacteraeota bacterium]|nr:thioesterase family protein [Candidatus Eremiobacteraeota bacterium]
MATTFEQATRLQAKDDIEFLVHLDPDWSIGRGVYGGLLAALLLKAFEERASLGRPRSLTVQYCAPATPGPARLQARLARQGTRTQMLVGSIEDQHGLVAQALATFGLSRTDERILDPTPPPAVAPPERLEPPPASPIMPTFTQHLDYRLCLGAMPYSGADQGLLGGWIRWREPRPHDFVGLAALLDAWPPAVLPLYDKPIKAATAELTYHFLSDELPQDDWLLFEATCPSLAAGYAEEQASLWSRRGKLLARAYQLVTIG